jgi:hypothetical protein
MTILSIDYQSQIKKIESLVVEGISAWKSAGEILVALYDADPLNRAKIKSELCTLPNGVLATLEKIGRRKLVPQVFIGSGPGFRKLAAMPYDVQERLLHSPVELLVLDQDGRSDTLKVAVKDLSKDQAAQVFNTNDTRDLSAQRAYLASIRLKAAPERIEDAYRLLKDRVIVTRPCELSRQQLASMLAQMG